MIQTAENVAKEAGIKREECDAISVRRYEQYLDALADDRAFQKRYMFPLEVQISKKKDHHPGRRTKGVTPCTTEGLAGLRTVLPGRCPFLRIADPPRGRQLRRDRGLPGIGPRN